MLSVNNLRKIFYADKGKVQAVDGISFEVKEGEFYTLLGPSGCGKTTTLQCVAGLESPDEGEIVMGDNPVYSSDKRIMVPAHRRDIGMVFQSYAIWPHMTVFENVAFPLSYGRLRLSQTEISKRVLNALKLVQLSGLESRPAPFLSGGQQQRVALARAIVHEPTILLLDEPLSNLDAKLREEMRFEIKELVSRLNITSLYVTHDQVEALSMSDRVAVMQSGKIIQEGTPKEIFLAPKGQFVASFLGKANFLKGQIVKHDGLFREGVVDATVGRLHCMITQEVHAGDAVLLAVRPSAIEVSARPFGENNNRLQGEIDSVTFVGDFQECGIRVGDQLLRVSLGPYEELKTGDRVYLHVKSERLVTVATI